MRELLSVIIRNFAYSLFLMSSLAIASSVPSHPRQCIRLPSSNADCLRLSRHLGGKTATAFDNLKDTIEQYTKNRDKFLGKMTNHETELIAVQKIERRTIATVDNDQITPSVQKKALTKCVYSALGSMYLKSANRLHEVNQILFLIGIIGELVLVLAILSVLGLCYIRSRVAQTNANH